MAKLARGKLLASGAAARQRRSKGRDAAWKKKFSSRVKWVNDKLRSILKCHVRLKLYLFFPPAFTVQSVHIYVVLSPTHKTAACLMTATGGFVSRHVLLSPQATFPSILLKIYLKRSPLWTCVPTYFHVKTPGDMMTYLSLGLFYSMLIGLKNLIQIAIHGLPVFKFLSIQDVFKKSGSISYLVYRILQYTYNNKPAEQKQARKRSLLRKWQAVLARMR